MKSLPHPLSPAFSIPKLLHLNFLNRKMGVIEVTLMEGLCVPGPVDFLIYLTTPPRKCFPLSTPPFISEENEAQQKI